MGRVKLLKERLTEVQKKVDVLEEKYIMGGEMTKETYDKFLARYRQEEADISGEMEKVLGSEFEP